MTDAVVVKVVKVVVMVVAKASHLLGLDSPNSRRLAW